MDPDPPEDLFNEGLDSGVESRLNRGSTHHPPSVGQGLSFPPDLVMSRRNPTLKGSLLFSFPV